MENAGRIKKKKKGNGTKYIRGNWYQKLGVDPPWLSHVYREMHVKLHIEK